MEEENVNEKAIHMESTISAETMGREEIPGEWTTQVSGDVIIQPLHEWMVDYMLPDFLEEHGVGEEQAKELLADAVSEECMDISCVADGQGMSGEECVENPAVLKRMQITWAATILRYSPHCVICSLSLKRKGISKRNLRRRHGQSASL